MALAALRFSRLLPISLCAKSSLAALNNAMSTASLPVAVRAMTGNAAPIALAEKQYQVLDRIKESFTVTRSQAYAVVGVGAAQYKVSPDDLIYVERLENVDVNDRVSLKHVHLLGSPQKTVIGRPLVMQASVLAVVEECIQDAKVLAFKKRRRKNSRRLKGHRQELTGMRILAIEGL